jgi:hypothetical protein
VCWWCGRLPTFGDGAGGVAGDFFFSDDDGDRIPNRDDALLLKKYPSGRKQRTIGLIKYHVRKESN